VNHSKEPWKLFVEFGLITIRDSNGKEVAFTNIQNSPILENHKRIVACVNACADITSERLEKYGVVLDMSADDLIAEVESEK